MAAEAEIEGVKNDIKKNGLREPIEIWIEDVKPLIGSGRHVASLLEGRCRREALRRLDIIDLSKVVRYFLASENPKIAADPEAYVRSKNLHRRHLSIEWKKGLARKYIKDNPQANNLEVAREAGLDDHTVAALREEMGSNSEIPKMDHSPMAGL